MKRAKALALLAFLLLPGCLDPLVGTQCVDGVSDCRNRCAPGACAMDGGGYDLGALDLATGEAGVQEAGTVGGALDAGESLDGGTSLDEGGEVQTATLDLADDLQADQVTAAHQDGRAADASDAGLVKSNDAPVDTRDTAVSDTRDSSSSNTTDVRDAAKDPVRLGSDSADSACQGCADAKANDAVGTDAPAADSAPEAQSSCPDQQALCNDICVDVQTDQTNCGRCGYDCSPRICTNGRCQTCPMGQTSCNAQCTDTQADPANCGGCGQLCATGACRFGVCKASTAGHIVVIGHDFSSSNTPMNQLLSNAVFLAQADPVQLAEYVGVAGANAVSNTHVVISGFATALARSVALSAASADNIVSQLTAADVFLIQSQSLATNSILMQLGQSWTKVLKTFVTTGGIIVLLDGSYPINNGTAQILAQAGLTTIAANSSVTNDTCTLKTAADPLASLLPSSYPCLRNSATFSGNGVHVVEDLGQPVVLHVTF